MRGSSCRKGKPLIVMVIDFSKVFDSVNLEALLRAMMWQQCDPMLIDLIVEIYSGDHADIFKGDVSIGRMEVNNGIRQECTGSPRLFVMIVNMIIKEIISSTLGYRDENSYIPALLFADDGLQLANSVKQAKRLRDVMKDAAVRCGLEMNLTVSV